jgi:hypothetical protein
MEQVSISSPLKKAVAQASLPADCGEATALFQRAVRAVELKFLPETTPEKVNAAIS